MHVEEKLFMITAYCSTIHQSNPTIAVIAVHCGHMKYMWPLLMTRKMLSWQKEVHSLAQYIPMEPPETVFVVTLPEG